MEGCDCEFTNGTKLNHGVEAKVGECTECLCANGTLQCEKVCYTVVYNVTPLFTMGKTKYIQLEFKSLSKTLLLR